MALQKRAKIKRNPSLPKIIALLAFFGLVALFSIGTTKQGLQDWLKISTAAAALVGCLAFIPDILWVAGSFKNKSSQNEDSSTIWYLAGAWIMACAMNASISWWGIYGMLGITNNTPAVILTLFLWAARIGSVYSFYVSRMPTQNKRR